MGCARLAQIVERVTARSPGDRRRPEEADAPSIYARYHRRLCWLPDLAVHRAEYLIAPPQQVLSLDDEPSLQGFWSPEYPPL
jgi:hypothetical protein